MYGTLRLTVIATLCLIALPQTVRGQMAGDQYAVAAHHYANARWPLAVEEFEQFLESHPDHARAESARFYLAEALLQSGRFQAAHRHYAEYLKNRPDSEHAAQAQFRLGETRYLDGQHAEARGALQQFTEAHPDDPLTAYAMTYLGEIALADAKPDEAREAFQQGLKLFPDGPLAQQCRFGLARSLEALGDAEGAIRFYQFLGGSDQRTSISDDALLQMAVLLYKAERFEESAAALQRLRKRYPASELAPHAAYWLGLCQTSLEHQTEAAMTLSEAANRYANHSLVPAMLLAAADAHQQAEAFEEAKQLLEQLLSQHPGSDRADDALQTLVQLAWIEKDYPRVHQLANRFFSRHPASPQLASVRQLAARAHLKQQDYQQAITLLQANLPDLLSDPAGDATAGADDQSPPVPSRVKQPTASQEVTSTRYYLALALLGSKRHGEALVQLDQLVEVREPDKLVGGIQAARASALLELKRYDQAVQPLSVYLSRQPAGPDAEKCRSQLAVTYARLGRWDDVRETFNVMREARENRQLFLSTVQYIAEVAYAQERRDVARLMFEELARDGNPEHYIAQGISGLAWIDWHQQQEADSSAHRFEELLQRFPDSPLAAEAAMMRGRALEQDDRPEGALAMYRLVMDRYGDSSHVDAAMLAAARVCDRLERDGEAEPLVRRWLERHPESPRRADALYQLAWILVDLEREEESDQVFEQLHRDFPDSRYWADATYRLAERAARAKELKRAESLADEIIDRAGEPQIVAYALYLQGQLAAAESRWEDVAGPLQRLLEAYPDSKHRLPAQYWLAEAYFRLRRYDEAGHLFAQLDQQTRQHTDAWVAMIPLRHAQVLAHHRQWDEAYGVAAKIAPRFPAFSQQHEVDYLIGRYHASRAEFQEAREAYRRVIRSKSGHLTETAAVAQWMIGETYFMQKQYDEAIKAYHRVEGLYDFPRWTAAALLQAGKCHEMVGRWSEAVKLYAKVVQDFAKTPFSDKAARRLRVAQQRQELMQTR